MDNVKQIYAFDSDKRLSDNAMIRGTEIILKETGSGKPLFRGHNKILVSGSDISAKKNIVFSMEPGEEFNYDASTDDPFGGIPNYDTPLQLATGVDMKYINSTAQYNPLTVFNNASYNPNTVSALRNLYEYFTRRVCLFCVGIDGCGIDNSRVFRVSNSKWITPPSIPGGPQYNSGYNDINNPGAVPPDVNVPSMAIVPFKVKAIASDLGTSDREKYFGRSISNNTVSYYFKTFDTNPIIRYRWADGSGTIASTTDIFAENKKADVDTVLELHMTITPSDCREFFKNRSALESARINTISLCTAIPYEAKDSSASGEVTRKYYRDIRPFTKFNFPNESLVDTSKGIEISYFLYF